MVLTERVLDNIAIDLNVLAKKYEDYFDNADSSIEVVCYAIAAVLKKDLEVQENKLIRACLESAIECLEKAAFDYYASWK